MNTENFDIVNPEEDVRHALLPLAVGKPKYWVKIVVISIIVFYLMMVLTYLTSAFLVDYVFVEIGIAILLFIISSYVYDYCYRCVMENTLDSCETGVVIEYSNKLLILSSKQIVQEIDTDEIRIRAAREDESENFYPKYTSVVECYVDGRLNYTLGIGKIPEFENVVLKPDYTKSDEDFECNEGDNMDN